MKKDYNNFIILFLFSFVFCLQSNVMAFCLPRLTGEPFPEGIPLGLVSQKGANLGYFDMYGKKFRSKLVFSTTLWL